MRLPPNPLGRHAEVAVDPEFGLVRVLRAYLLGELDKANAIARHIPGVDEWRRGWDSNPRARFWQARRFRGAPVMTTSVPLRENYALESRATESLKRSWRWLNDSAAQRLDDPIAPWPTLPFPPAPAEAFP